jgi:hypothetical protein
MNDPDAPPFVDAHDRAQLLSQPAQHAQPPPQLLAPPPPPLQQPPPPPPPPAGAQMSAVAKRRHNARWRLNPNALGMLESAFHRGHFPTLPEKDLLAVNLNVR